MGEVFILWDWHQGIRVGVVGYASRPLADEYKRYMVVEYASSADIACVCILILTGIIF